MPHLAAQGRFRAEADHALSRLKHYHEQGDRERVDHWHRVWSLAEAALEAELVEPGGGARLVRRREPPPLRPLPDGLPPAAPSPPSMS